MQAPPIRHAKSGLQFGADATAPGLKIEVKAYLQKPPPDVDLLGKLLQAAIDGANPPDIWVLATTLPCSSQTVDALTAAGRRLGIEIVVLDWQTGPAPALLVLFAAAYEATLHWISDHHPQLGDMLQSELHRLRAITRDFRNVAEALRLSLTPTPNSYIATPEVMAASYLRAFADRAQAMILFGQALTPLSAGEYIDRPSVFDRLDKQFQGKVTDKPLVILQGASNANGCSSVP
jgi:hypothetical protein